MRHIVTPEILIRVKDSIDQFSQLYPHVVEEFLLFVYSEDGKFLIIFNISYPEYSVTSISAVSAVNKDIRSKEFFSKIYRFSTFDINFNMYLMLAFRMSVFVFEEYFLSGMYHQIKDNKQFYYLYGKKQEEK